MDEQRYRDLFAMIKNGKAILPNGEVSNKLSDLKAVDYKFRISAPACNACVCKDCSNYKICWE